jgi:cytoplasmic iron level regulating protein YaaA (DUF328/UPF0246 family)
MITLLSPAKDLATEVPTGIRGTTQPALLVWSEPLIARLRTYTPKKLAGLMELSDKLATLNHARYQQWTPAHTPGNSRPAAFVFNGEAYKGLDVRSLGADDLRFAQHHLRILSGLYGLLRPLDLIQDHRLEMGTALPVARKKDLYAYWGDRIAERLREELAEQGSNVLLNLASTEYFKAARAARLGVRVVTPVFKDKGPGGYRTVMIFAKHQRGAMARYAIQHRLLEPEPLKAYDGDGYRFSAADSTATEWVFLRG